MRRSVGGVGDVRVRVLLFVADREMGIVRIEKPDERVYGMLFMWIVVELSIAEVKWIVAV